jgi:hypothetical protein
MVSDQQLQRQISELSAALKQSATADDKTRESLGKLQHEIEDFLHAAGDRSLGDRLEKLAIRFEADHPAVGTALRQAIDALAKAGM